MVVYCQVIWYAFVHYKLKERVERGNTTLIDIIMKKDVNTNINERNITGFIILFAMFVGAAAIAGLHGAKLISVGSLVFDAGLITFALTFLCTDIVSEVYGKLYAKRLIIGGLVAIIVGLI